MRSPRCHQNNSTARRRRRWLTSCGLALGLGISALGLRGDDSPERTRVVATPTVRARLVSDTKESVDAGRDVAASPTSNGDAKSSRTPDSPRYEVAQAQRAPSSRRSAADDPPPPSTRVPTKRATEPQAEDARSSTANAAGRATRGQGASATGGVNAASRSGDAVKVFSYGKADADRRGGAGEGHDRDAGLKLSTPGAPARAIPVNSAEVAAVLKQRDIHAARFQDITPGETTLADVRSQLGEPRQQSFEDGQKVWVYRIGPFPKVALFATDSIVESVLVELNEPTTAVQAGRDLALTSFSPARVEEDTGELIGLVFPERGITFYIETRNEESVVTHVLLGPIDADGFRMRAEGDVEHQYVQQLADLRLVRMMQPNDARAFAMEAEIRIRVGQFRRALELIDQAVKLAPKAMEHRLARARILAKIERHDEALEVTRAVLASDRTSDAVRAMARMQLGDLLADGPTHDYTEAMTLHSQAIQQAAPLSTDSLVAVRVVGRELLLYAHLAAANDVARGRWRDKPQTMEKWLAGAESVVGALENEQEDVLPEWRLATGTLRAYAGAPTMADSQTRADECLTVIRDVVNGATDPLFKQQLYWEAAEALLQASQISHQRQDLERALEYARQAATLVDLVVASRDPTLERDYTAGRVHFAVGALTALVKKDHASAVESYRKAAEKFTRPLPASAQRDRGLHGERLVSMGVSYWQAGDKEQGMRWTRSGMQLMQDAVQRGELDKRTLAVPYNNLARMYRELGQKNESTSYTELASQAVGRGSSRRK